MKNRGWCSVHIYHLLLCFVNMYSATSPMNESDSENGSEQDLEYGPGIVEKLREKFQRLSGMVSRDAKVSPHATGKRCPSVDDILSTAGEEPSNRSIFGKWTSSYAVFITVTLNSNPLVLRPAVTRSRYTDHCQKRIKTILKLPPLAIFGANSRVLLRGSRLTAWDMQKAPGKMRYDRI
ncbi:hypothetical protein OSTOST_06074 [Ostertagia ostertagi]